MTEDCKKKTLFSLENFFWALNDSQKNYNQVLILAKSFIKIKYKNLSWKL